MKAKSLAARGKNSNFRHICDRKDFPSRNNCHYLGKLAVFGNYFLSELLVKYSFELRIILKISLKLPLM